MSKIRTIVHMYFAPAGSTIIFLHDTARSPELYQPTSCHPLLGNVAKALPDGDGN